MNTYTLKNVKPQLFNNPVVSIGFFDGFHKGHQYLISMLLKRAKELKSELVLITLWPHPRTVININKQIYLINTLSEKTEQISKTGLKHLLILDFTKELSNLSTHDFLHQIIISKIGSKHLIMGYDNHIGHGRDKFETVDDIAKKLGIVVESADIKIQVSSTRIRELLAEGNIEQANELLGYKYSITGNVIKGKQLGRKIGYPTANIKLNDNNKILPQNGVYTVNVVINGKLYGGMLNIGVRPTINNNNATNIEVNIFEFEQNIYNNEITIQFVSRLRCEQKFESIIALTAQLAIDKVNAKNILNK